MSKYKEGDFGYWWTVIEGKPDIEGQVYNGYINCSFENLTSLKGAPKEVKGGFDCSSNQLTSLEFCPEIVNGTFDCSNNKLISLKYCPEKINGGFYCYNNKLTSLEHCPEKINGNFCCSYNQIKDKNEFKNIKFCENVNSDFDNAEIMNLVIKNSPYPELFI